MITTSADILNIALAAGFSFIAIFLCIALYFLIFILRDTAETMRVVRRTAESIDEMLIQPLAFVAGLIGHVGTFLNMFGGVMSGMKKGKRK